MSIHRLGDPKKIELGGIDGEIKTYHLYRFPATVGFKLSITYGEGLISSKTRKDDLMEGMREILKYVAWVTSDGTEVFLVNDTFINEHAGDTTRLIALQAQMMEHNFGFLSNGANGNGLITRLVEFLTPILTEKVTPFLHRLFPPEPPHSKN